MPQAVRNRTQNTIEFSTNNKVSENLSRGMVYRELYLNLSGALTVIAGNNTYANLLRGDEWACVKRIDIIANGSETIRSISGNSLRWLNYFWFGKTPRVSPLMGAGGANPTFNSVLIMPFWMPRSIRPIDTALDSRILSSLTVEVTWGTYTDIIASATGWTTEPTIEISSLESFNVSGPFSQWRFWEIEKEITATNSRFQIELPVGGVYRGMILNTTDAGVDDGDVLNRFKLVSGSTTFADLKEEVLQDIYPMRHNLRRGMSGTAYDDLFLGDANSIDGWYAYDHVTDGLLSEGIDTVGFSEMKVECDVTIGGGTTKLIVIPQEIIPVRAQAAAA